MRSCCVALVLVLSLVSTSVGVAGSRRIISTYAGGGNGDGGPAIHAPLWPGGLARDGRGNLYVADENRVRKIQPDGTITTVAGNGIPGFSGDGGPATAAQLHSPVGVADDSTGTLYIADYSNHRVRKVTPDGTIATVAGNGIPGFSGDGGPATDAALDRPSGIALDAAGNLYVADSSNHRIRRIATDGTIRTMAGDGTPGFSGDGGPAVTAQLKFPHGVAVDAAGTIYIADSRNNRVRKVTPDGTITTLAGTGIATGIDSVPVCPPPVVQHPRVPSRLICFPQETPVQFVGDGGPAVLASLSFPFRVTLAADGLYIADSSHQRVRKMTPDGVITTVAGNGKSGYGGDGGVATSATLWSPSDVAVDPSGRVYISDSGNFRIRAVMANGTISTTAGNGYCCYGGDGGAAIGARLDDPTSVVFDSSGAGYIADSSNHRIRRVAPDGTVTTIAGTGILGYAGDGGPATAAELAFPSSVAVDSTGSVFIADTINYRIRKVKPGGTITAVAGTGTAGFSGDDGPATAAEIGQVVAIALDGAGNLYLGDTNSSRVRKVAPDGTITTVAGNGTAGFSGDGGPATEASLGDPVGLAVDDAGNLYISLMSRVRKVSPEGIITTVAGNGTAGFSGDGGPATEAALFSARGVAVDRMGNLYIADTVNQRVRKVAKSRKITTVAGNGTAAFSGDGGLATASALSYPVGVAIGAEGNVYIADTGNDRIRTVS